jgi:hypothetical protein
MNEEMKNNNKLIDDLKNLPKVAAPPNFEANLWRKINSSNENTKIGLWEKLLSPGKLFPGAVAVATAVLIFFVFDLSSESVEDPLNLEPRLREDLIVLDQFDEKDLVITEKPEETSGRKNEAKKNDIVTEPPQVQSMESDESREKSTLGKEKSQISEMEIADSQIPDSFKTEQGTVLGSAINPAPVTATSNEISKDNLNFMKINLSAKERQQVEQLKQRIQATEKAKSE